MANDTRWKSIQLLIAIYFNCMAPEYTYGELRMLETMILKWHEMFAASYTAAFAKLKHHYALHIPLQLWLLGPAKTHWCMRFEAKHQWFKRLCQRTSWKNILVTLSMSHQLWIAWKLEAELPNMTEPVIGTVITEEPIATTSKFHALVCTAMKLQLCERTLPLPCKWVSGFKYHGSNFKMSPGSYFKIATSRTVNAALLEGCIDVTCGPGVTQLVLVYKCLQRVPHKDVSPSIVSVYGRQSWFFDKRSLAVGKKQISSLSFVDIKLCKLVKCEHPGNWCMLIEF